MDEEHSDEYRRVTSTWTMDKHNNNSECTSRTMSATNSDASTRAGVEQPNNEERSDDQVKTRQVQANQKANQKATNN
jgi:hypothetical protein